MYSRYNCQYVVSIFLLFSILSFLVVWILFLCFFLSPVQMFFLVHSILTRCQFIYFILFFSLYSHPSFLFIEFLNDCIRLNKIYAETNKIVESLNLLHICIGRNFHLIAYAIASSSNIVYSVFRFVFSLVPNLKNDAKGEYWWTFIEFMEIRFLTQTNI